MALHSDLTSNLSLLVLVLLLCHAVQSEVQFPMSAIVGKDITLKCDLPRSEPAMVRWHDFVYNTDRDPILIYDSTNAGINTNHARKDEMAVDDDFQLTLKAVNLDSAGLYFCESQINATTTLKKTYDLTVGGMPQCSGEGKLIDGGRIDLLCASEFSGADMPSLEWFQGDLAIGSEDDAQISIAKRRVVMDASPDLDKVLFTCRMSFGEMQEECAIPMDIKYRVRNLRFTPPQDSYRAGQEVRCEASGNPAPRISLLPDTAQKSGDGYKSMMIDPLWEGTEVQLACTASNMFQDETEILSKNISFKVLEDPNKPDPLPVQPSEAAQPSTNGGDTTNPKASTSMAAIVAGIVIGAIMLVAILIIIVCIRRRKGKKIPKGAKPVATKEDEIRREMDGKA